MEGWLVILLLTWELLIPKHKKVKKKKKKCYRSKKALHLDLQNRRAVFFVKEQKYATQQSQL